jgi:Domain of unknown function DUF488
MADTFYTIGHARHSVDEFAALLMPAGVDFLVDVRAFPRSRSNPQFNADTLPRALSQFGIGYQHVPELGGRRPRQPEVPPRRNALWTNRSFHNYADYAEGDAFRAGLARLMELGRGDHVRGGGVVALPPPHHRRLSSRPRRVRFSHPPRRPRPAGATNARRAPAPRRHPGVPRRCACLIAGATETADTGRSLERHLGSHRQTDTPKRIVK